MPADIPDLGRHSVEVGLDGSNLGLVLVGLVEVEHVLGRHETARLVVPRRVRVPFEEDGDENVVALITQRLSGLDDLAEQPPRLLLDILNLHLKETLDYLFYLAFLQ